MPPTQARTVPSKPLRSAKPPPEQALAAAAALVRPPVKVTAGRFQAMSGLKRTGSGRAADAEVIEEAEGEGEEGEAGEGGEEDEEEEDEGEGDDGTGKSSKVKHPQKRNASSTGRKKITISYIEDKARRSVTFTKRKSGLMKKAYELSTLTGTNVLVVVVSESGMLYHFSTPALNGVASHPRGRDVIAAALAGELDNPEDGTVADEQPKKPQQRKKSTAKAASATTPVPSGSTSGPFGADELPVPPLAHQQQPGLPSPLNLNYSVPSPVLGYPSVLAPPPLPASEAAYPPILPHPSTSSAPLFPHYGNAHLPPSLSPFGQPNPLSTLPALNSAPDCPFGQGPSSAPVPSSTPSASTAATPMTPYELARLSHAQAFASYQAASPFNRVGSYALGSARAAEALATNPLVPVGEETEEERRKRVARALALLGGDEAEVPPASTAAESSTGAGAEAEKSAETSGKKRKHGADEFGAEAQEWSRRVKERAAGTFTGRVEEMAAVLSASGAGDGKEGEGEKAPDPEEERWRFDPGHWEGAGVDESTRDDSPEERREKWKAKLREAVDEAKKYRTLRHAFRAHAYSLLVDKPIPPLLPIGHPNRAYSIVLETSDPLLCYHSLEHMCRRAGWEDEEGLEEVLEKAVVEFLERWLPHELGALPPDFRHMGILAAKPHLTALFDFLEAHEILSFGAHLKLVQFRGITPGGGGGEGRERDQELEERLYGTKAPTEEKEANQQG
ncbi:hypothetical protein JCM8097_004542 [Rhodosporidiobolus ruineniae]